ncbi:MAG: D-alanine--(R)-lactate ligase, partial [Lachnospiraceae bacterium]|nr:D-alanine--(R)-lactate ligase [Lachnospiraceae bacterium]
MPEHPKKVAVLFGGRSPEYGVSLQSAAAVISHMDRKKSEPVPVGITHTGDWFYYGG